MKVSGHFLTENKEQNGLKTIAGNNEFCYPVRKKKTEKKYYQGGLEKYGDHT